MELDALIDRALHDAITHVHADSGTIHIKEPGEQVLRLAASHGIPESVLAIVQRVPWGKGMAGLAAERAQPVDACNIQTTGSSDVRPGARATGLAGAIVVPIMLGESVIGTLGVGCRAERSFTQSETAWLLDHGRALAHALAEAKLTF